MDLTVQHLRCFVAVAEELNFTRAARRLHLSPSTVSEQITLLERRLGRPLFVRTPRTVQPTAAAGELLPLAHRAVTAMDQVVTWATGPDTASTVVVGVMASSEQFRALLAGARSTAPGVDWRIRQLGFEPPYDALLRRDLDAAVLAEIGPARRIAGIVAHDLWQERLVVVAHENHPLVERRRLRLGDLAAESLICGPHGLENEQWFAAILALIPGTPKVLATATNLEELVEMCAAGIGIAVSPASVIQMFPRPGLAFVPLHEAPPATLRLHVRRDDPARTVAVLVDRARELFS
ncbi:LysR substrate-binding domain-containing protein [Actinoplanes sp. NPDC051851]|uniref:LysR family transcriptional regulator n=1 Tax=Actinoplanes sp. NPDC051851 TaxID=3154753 RepID=UPI00342BFA63